MPTNADKNWRVQAACLDCPPELFFPRSTSEAIEVNRAKQICRSCDVRAKCLQFALDTQQERGIWGGTDEKERSRLRRR
jgi:WhiB family redox-sensing transcriptional regulator